jgi:hypothetical protein
MGLGPNFRPVEPFHLGPKLPVHLNNASRRFFSSILISNVWDIYKHFRSKNIRILKSCFLKLYPFGCLSSTYDRSSKSSVFFFRTPATPCLWAWWPSFPDRWTPRLNQSTSHWVVVLPKTPATDMGSDGVWASFFNGKGASETPEAEKMETWNHRTESLLETSKHPIFSASFWWRVLTY